MLEVMTTGQKSIAERHRAGLVVRALDPSPCVGKELKRFVIPGIQQNTISKCDVNSGDPHDCVISSHGIITMMIL